MLDPLKPNSALQLGNNGSLNTLSLLFKLPDCTMPRSRPSVDIASLALKSLSCSNLTLMSLLVTIQFAGPRRVVLWMMLAVSSTLYIKAMLRSV